MSSRFENDRLRLSVQKIDRITKFGRRFGLRLETYNHDGRSIWLFIDQDQGGLLPPGQAQRILEKQRLLTADMVSRSKCFSIAANAVHDGTMTGMIQSVNMGSGPLVESGSHAINYIGLRDGTVVAIDLTADYNIDFRMGNFQVLGIGAKNMKTLLSRLSRLYDGTWHELSREEIELYYTIEHGAEQERMAARREIDVLYCRKESKK